NPPGGCTAPGRAISGRGALATGREHKREVEPLASGDTGGEFISHQYLVVGLAPTQRHAQAVAALVIDRHQAKLAATRILTMTVRSPLDGAIPIQGGCVHQGKAWATASVISVTPIIQGHHVRVSAEH